MLRKPQEKNIRIVALVLLLSDSSEPPAPESIKIKGSIPLETKTGDAFIAKEFNISDFKGDEIEILLRKFKENRRKKREAVQVDALKPKVKYRATQMNTDEFGNRTWSYWSEEFGAFTAPSGPPLNVTFISRSKSSLGISWKAPVESTRKSKLTGYRVCFFTNDTSPECLILKSPKVFSLALKNLRPSTKYFVTVSASTEHGYGEKSPEVSKITNKGPVNLIATSFYTMTVNIPKQQEYIKFFESQDSYYSTEWSDSIYTITKHSDGNKEPKIGNKYVNEGNSVYETPDDVIEKIERNEGACGMAKGHESSDYMSLKDKREPTNVYQALQPHGTNDGQSHSKVGGQTSVEYQNPVFSADPNAA
ncbi:uncharacterized protein LOC114525363 [Dendronephthya gigantea]|uniref:uncharacterized protein LOC114525363 n=1 Tax=Dendronephthya gigantea TaxID=151771 RepID=UPI0010699B7F|nr:uncharacterized protein LOC114525363 [Dendronephthya gigantea]